MLYLNRHLIFIFFAISLVSCKKWISIDAPTTSINQENVYTSDGSAIAVLTGLYSQMSLGNSNFVTGSSAIWLYAGLSADEFNLVDGITSNTLINYYRNSLSVTIAQSTGSEYWSNLYNYIYTCNAAIEGITKSTSLSEGIRNQLIGEAKFTRAFCFFYLVNLFGDVPLTLTTDQLENRSLPRSSVSDVYLQIIEDCKEAQSLLNEKYLDASLTNVSLDRNRPTKWSAIALLARVSLYIEDWVNAEKYSSLVINNTGIFKLSTLNTTFLKASLGNNEAIWQLQPVRTGWNTEDAKVAIIPSSGFSGNSYPVYLSSSLLSRFEVNDKRAVKGNWVNAVTLNGITYTFPYKYKSAKLNDPVTEHLMVFRLGELLLIRAEANAHLNKIQEALSDLNAIRTRAGLESMNLIDKTSVLNAILKERQVELFSEWGHRWLDLKRTHNVDLVMSVVTPQKAAGTLWQSYQQLYPISLNDLERNFNLTQNDGY